MNLEEAVALGKSRSDCHPDNIDTLVQIVKRWKDIPGFIVECGSYRCGATIAMAAADPQKTVIGFDTFGGLPYGPDQKGFENFANTNFAEILATTSQFDNIILMQGKHEEELPLVSKYDWNMHISILFMDSDFYESHVVCLTHLWPRLVSGGIAIFHDWAFPGVQKAIQEVIPASEKLDAFFSDSPNMGFIIKK